MSANYLEALERWDTGAVQSWMSQGVVRLWWWMTFLVLLMMGTAIIAPSFTSGVDLIAAFRHPWEVQT